MFEICMKKINCRSDIDWDEIVKKTEGYSGADIALVIYTYIYKH